MLYNSNKKKYIYDTIFLITSNIAQIFIKIILEFPFNQIKTLQDMRRNPFVTFQRARALRSAAIRSNAIKRPVSVPAGLCSPVVTVPPASRATGT